MQNSKGKVSIAAGARCMLPLRAGNLLNGFAPGAKVTMDKGPGRRIRQLRKAHGLTLAQFGAIIGLSPSQLSLVERGERGLTLDRLRLICLKFHVTAEKILFG